MKPTVLLADGDAELCELYQMFLSDCGYEVETATDGLECLEKLRQASPAILVLDLALRWGGPDGVLEWLRKERSFSHIRVILTCGPCDSLALAQDCTLPIVACLFKPFVPEALLESLRFAVTQDGFDNSTWQRRLNACSELFIG